MKINIVELKSQFSSANYYRSCKSLVNKIGSHFQWTPDIMDTDLYDANYSEIVRVIIDKYTIRNPGQLSSKLSSLNYPMKLSGYTGEFSTRAKVCRTNVQFTADPPLEKNTISWNDMLEILKTARSKAKTKGAALLCTTYMHGYCLRCGEIALTSIIDDLKYNFLDIPNLKWYIRASTTKNRSDREFSVTQAYVDEIKPFIRATGFLIGKVNGGPYTSNFTLKTVGLNNMGFTVNSVRNSFETANHDSDESNDAKTEKSLTLGHTVNTAIAHYTPPIIIKKRIRPIIKLKEKPQIYYWKNNPK